LLVIRKIIIHNTIGPAIFADRFNKGIFSNVALCGHKIKNIKERYNDIIIRTKNLIISKSRYPGNIIKNKTMIRTNIKDMNTNQRKCFGSKIEVSKSLGFVFFIVSSIVIRLILIYPYLLTLQPTYIYSSSPPLEPKYPFKNNTK
jgi:hypothetical protein